MSVSVFDLFSIGVGPSSSHTVGPMRAVRHFFSTLSPQQISQLTSVKICLYGSLALTGIGHGTDKAVICGMEGWLPETVPLAELSSACDRLRDRGVAILGAHPLAASAVTIEWIQENLFGHPNGLRISTESSNGISSSSIFYSVGGGFVTDEWGAPISISRPMPRNANSIVESKALLEKCSRSHRTISEVMRANELQIRTAEEISEGLQKIWQVMDESITNGMKTDGILPGGLMVRRRAKKMAEQLATNSTHAIDSLEYLSVYALAVNEENANFGRIVTAPTNGAAGIVPAIFKFYLTQLGGTLEKLEEYLLTAGAIALLFKEGASLSAAEVGCQGEIGVASSMAAGALTAIRGGTPAQVETAAEIAIEHSLGLTCDPIRGLVQIPCIERNTIGAAKALTASQLALRSDGTHIVSLDQAIATMKRTGLDMMSKYKETSTGGLAITVSAPEC